ncbi:1211_t:CDS:2 [Diversispora eburnea]|uniref:1211_t:CDS:1 n=1 Tax=Diversispora eburnea TaxID=1213867 RepID=A0A9N9BXE8_9GLOM|nr:1211_t:CDS:2 [Diversispora eburnea]
MGSSKIIAKARTHYTINGPGCPILRDGPYLYKDVLGGLCLTCAEYGYGVFDNLKELVINDIMNKDKQNKLINEIEYVQ